MGFLIHGCESKHIFDYQYRVTGNLYLALHLTLSQGIHSEKEVQAFRVEVTGNFQTCLSPASITENPILARNTICTEHFSVGKVSVWRHNNTPSLAFCMQRAVNRQKSSSAGKGPCTRLIFLAVSQQFRLGVENNGGPAMLNHNKGRGGGWTGKRKCGSLRAANLHVPKSPLSTTGGDG